MSGFIELLGIVKATGWSQYGVGRDQTISQSSNKPSRHFSYMNSSGNE
ncbi:hypothetical protein [Echinimonas agarilytica]|uniref:Uncharacterized protein n=1 Tax=Echinimonas agarilytica TaxID=1215918 RepID=A0AA42B7M9_9GAMM|nr:hypothetical protein [Echinimonas agarilytica]MCM2679912.1 hypothetical protein [Echinimonas agarilytica]